MLLSEVRAIFDREKEELLRDVLVSPSPTAYILGGQPSSGKSSLVGRLSASVDAFAVNGDNYRIYHPEHDALIQDQDVYSRETQPFSNVFTEGFIEEAIKRRFSVIIEGTMRSPDVVMRTVERFYDAGFNVEIHCIASPPEYTGINLFARYETELKLMGAGRLADRSSHDEAASSLLVTLDRLYQQGYADRIALYEIFARRIACDYEQRLGQWTLPTPPSETVLRLRSIQLQDLPLRASFLLRGQKVLDDGLLTTEQAEELKERLNQIAIPFPSQQSNL